MTNYTLTNLKEYKENQYEIKLKDHLEKYIDYDELHFIESELLFFKNCYDTANIKLLEIEYSEYNRSHDVIDYGTRLEYGIDYSEIRGSANKIVHDEIIFVFDESLETGLYDLVRCEQLKVTFSKILSFLNDKKEQLTTEPHQTETAPENSLNWQGSELHFTELTKALFETKLISPEITQKEFFKRMKQFFNVKDFDDKEKLKGIRARTKDLTPFINTIETSLNNWIKNKD